MATTYKILGRGVGGPAPAATVYTVPSGKCAVISCITVTNNNNSAQNVSVYITPDASTVGSTTHQIVSGAPMPAYGRAGFNWGISMSAGQTLKVNGSAGFTMVVFGSEIDL